MHFSDFKQVAGINHLTKLISSQNLLKINICLAYFNTFMLTVKVIKYFVKFLWFISRCLVYVLKAEREKNGICNHWKQESIFCTPPFLRTMGTAVFALTGVNYLKGSIFLKNRYFYPKKV